MSPAVLGPTWPWFVLSTWCQPEVDEEGWWGHTEEEGAHFTRDMAPNNTVKKGTKLKDSILVGAKYTQILSTVLSFFVSLS